MGLFERRRTGRRRRWGRVVDLTAEESPRLVWGKPSRCPRCDGAGYLDHIDLLRRVMLQHCPDCWHKWETSEAETHA